MILKLSTCNRCNLLCICVCRAWSHNIFQFFVALMKNFPTSSNSLKNAMLPCDRNFLLYTPYLTNLVTVNCTEERIICRQIENDFDIN